LPAPVLGFGDEQPLAAGAAEDIVVKRALGEGVAVVQQNLLGQLRVGDKYRLEAKVAVDHDRLVVEILPPARHRVAHQAGKQAEKRQPSGRRFRHFDYARI